MSGWSNRFLGIDEYFEEKESPSTVLTVGIVNFNTNGLVSFPTDCPKVILFESCTVSDVTMLEIQGLKHNIYCCSQSLDTYYKP